MHSGLKQLGEAAWNRLDTAEHPLLSFAFLEGLERCGVLAQDSGWRAHHIAIHDQHGLAAAVPCYQKLDSHGEFVFDWAWAQAYHQHGIPYYPKLLGGIPYSPVPGPRLLVRRNHPEPGKLRRALTAAMVSHAASAGFSGVHCNFVPAVEHAAFDTSPWLQRKDWQFHWHNRGSGYADFEDFLGQLKSRKRKKIRRERRSVQRSGIRTRTLRGESIDDDTLAFAYRCYQRTFEEKGNYPALNIEFFRHLRQQLGEGLVINLGISEQQPVACAILISGGGRLYGRYWGRARDVDERDYPGLHFELCYYLGIELCIREGYSAFEPGAQGEHKIARGFVPVPTYSFHHLCHPAFQQAIGRHLQQERSWVAEYGESLQRKNPYREPSA